MLASLLTLLAQAEEDRSIDLVWVVLVLAAIALIVFIFGGISRWRR